MGGGAGTTKSQVNNAISGDVTLANRGLQNQGEQYDLMKRAQTGATDFYNTRMKFGLPEYRNMIDFNKGNIAQSFAPIRGELLRRTGNYAYLPSGYRDKLIANLGAQQGRAYDQSLFQAQMANEMAKQQGAAGLTGQEQIAGNQSLAYGGQAGTANEAILRAPRKPSPWATIGGAALGGLQTAAAFA